MSSSTKKKRKPSLKPSPVLPRTPESSPISLLPDDVLVSFIARVSALYYPTLSLVSKRYRSILTSPELHETRSLLGRHESCLFLCFRFAPDYNPRWFTLCLKPDQTLTLQKKKKKSSGYVLAPIPVLEPPQDLWEQRLVAVGSNIYAVGGPINEAPSSSVSILDCRSHTWREAPSMRVERSFTTVNVCDEKIYVTGGCKDYDTSNWMEVFDPKTQTWELISESTLAAERCGYEIHYSAVIDGEIAFIMYKGVAYKPKEDRWEVIENNNMSLGWVTLSSCVIGNVLYSYNISREIKWYDTKRRCWMDVKGLKNLPKVAGYALKRLVEYGGKMVVLWDKFLPSSGYKKKVICCAVISLERRNGDEIWGSIEWFDGVLTVPKSYGFVCALAATV